MWNRTTYKCNFKISRLERETLPFSYRKSYVCSKIVDEHQQKVKGRHTKNNLGQVSGNKQVFLFLSNTRI